MIQTNQTKTGKRDFLERREGTGDFYEGKEGREISGLAISGGRSARAEERPGTSSTHARAV
jgi:hypothetical protein